jgi:flagellar hook-associated protein 2
MGNTIGPSSGLNPQYQRLIQRTLQIESQPKVDLQNQRKQKKNTKSIVSDLDGKLSSLQSQLSTLTDPVSSPFEGRSASAEEGTNAFGVSADKTASTGTHSLAVDRLASEDRRVSQEYSAGGSDLSNAFNSTQTFDVGVATPSDSNTDRKSVQVEVAADAFNGTNEEVLKNIRSAIDSAFQNAVDNGDISSDERPDLSVVNPTSNTARLSVRSSETGFQGRLDFSNVSGELISDPAASNDNAALGLNGDFFDGSDDFGKITEVGTSESGSKLTSEFTLDGLTLTRNSNEVDDALDGVTINLDEANGTESSFEVTADEEGAKSAVQEFVDRFNKVISFLRDKTEVNPEKDKRGALASDSTFQRLQRQLRSDATRPVEGQPDNLRTLADIGIEANRDGTLKLNDEEALRSAVREDQDALKDLFAGPDGVATRLEERVDQFVDTGGILDSREDSIENTVDRLDDRIQQFDNRLERREEQLRDRYAQVQSTLRRLSNQQQAVTSRF